MEEGTYKALFAPLGAVQAPKKRRARAKAVAAKPAESRPAEAPAAAPA